MSDIAQDLGGVVRLLEKATPGPWRHVSENGSPTTGMNMIAGSVPGYIANVRDTGTGRVVSDARLIAAAVNFLREHSAEIAGALRDAERYRWLRMRLAAEELDNEDAARMALSMVGPIGFRPADSDYCGELDTAIDSAMQQGGGGGEAAA